MSVSVLNGLIVLFFGDSIHIKPDVFVRLGWEIVKSYIISALDQLVDNTETVSYPQMAH